MAIRTIRTDTHWNYFLSTEADLLELARFVEFDKRNYKCFSVEIARLLMAAAAEVDVACKQLCKTIKPTSQAGTINQYRDEIIHAFPMIPGFEVVIPRHGLRLKPWTNWRQRNKPHTGGLLTIKRNMSGTPNITRRVSKMHSMQSQDSSLSAYIFTKKRQKQVGWFLRPS